MKVPLNCAIDVATTKIRKLLDDLDMEQPVFGLTLGSGLDDLAERIDIKEEIDYQNIKYFPRTTVKGHAGKLVLGEIEGVPLIGLRGRKHFYEVANNPEGPYRAMQQVVLPVQVLANLGVQQYFVTNAAGGLNPDYEVGDVMVIGSHIHHMFVNPLIGKPDTKTIEGNEQELFQPMNNEYDASLRAMLHQAGHVNHTHEGVYLAVTGPSYETKGECQAFRAWGADAVGMSTTPEVIVARNRGMDVVGMSCITNVIAEDGTNKTDHEEVANVLNSPAVRSRLADTVSEFFHIYSVLRR